jgi:hypothetical protein
VRIREIDTRRRADVRAFIGLPFALYREHPLWVPPIRTHLRLSLDRRRHPYYRHSDAAFFLVEDGRGRPLGRIAALDHHTYNTAWGTRDALFHLFESVDDPGVAGLLFEAAAAWAREHRLERLLGPKGFAVSEGHGILVDGFDHPPVLGMPYHPPYYERLITGLGLEPEVDLVSATLPRDYPAPEGYREAVEQAAEQTGYRVDVFRSRRDLRRHAPLFADLFNRIFADHWGVHPLTPEEAQLLTDRFIPIADPAIVGLIMRGDEIAGVSLLVPDISPAVRRARGRLVPLGWYRILRAARRSRVVGFGMVGLLPEHRGAGGNLALYAYLARRREDTRYEQAEFVQIVETNTRMMRNLEQFDIPWSKRHRVYRKDL